MGKDVRDSDSSDAGAAGSGSWISNRMVRWEGVMTTEAAKKCDMARGRGHD